MKITDENYYTPEANRMYLSASSFKAFLKCEAAALAESRGEWGRKSSPALMVGNYVDAYLTGDLKRFRQNNPELYKRDGTLKLEFQQAHAMAERLERDELARMLLSGQHQVTKTGLINGVWFKGRFDSLLDEEQVEAICRKFPEVRKLVPLGGAMIVDLKTTRDFKAVWNDEAHAKMSFINAWRYDIQGAIYQRLDGRHAPFVIVGVTKEPEPNIAAVHIPDSELALAMDEVEDLAPRFAAIKRGEIEPVPCGKCDYCRSRKQLSSIDHYMIGACDW